MKLAIEGGKPYLKQYDLTIRPGKEEIASVMDTLQKGYLADFEGRQTVGEFEKKFAGYHSIKYAVACNSGTAAIHSAIAAMKAPEKKEVLVPAYTFITGVTPLLLEGLEPVFVDVDLKTLGMDLQKTKESVSENTIGLLPAHLYGFPCHIKYFSKMARQNNHFLIEDCCQAHGAKVGKKIVGTFGEVGCFSFFLRKNMTTGEGGMAITLDEGVYQELKSMRQCGKSKPNSLDFDRLGFNYRMTDLTAAVGIPQLAKLNSNNKARLENAKIYTKRFKRMGFGVVPIQENTVPVYFKYPAFLPDGLVNNKVRFAQALRAENVPLVPFNTIPLPRVKFLKEIAEKRGFKHKFWKQEFPIADYVHERLINFYTVPQLSSNDIEVICDAIEKVVNNGL